MKETKIITSITRASLSINIPFFADLENQGFEVTNVIVKMAPYSGDSIVDPLTTITVVLQREKPQA